ncbi:MAG: methyltransferase domain-containing protein [Chitinophagaceae bacterium]
MQDTHWFETWFGSPYYAVLYQHRDEEEAGEFVRNLLEYLQPLPNSKMLDIACGEGRFSIELADRGFDVSGLDLSHLSIDVAKKSERENLHFYVHDMRMPFYINYFDYAFNFFTSFGYFEHNRDHQLAAKSFASGLKKDGILVLDYMNSELAEKKLVPEETVTRGDYEFHLKRRLEAGHFIKEISFNDAEGHERKYTERVAAFKLADFIPLFQHAGLKLVGTFGDYKLRDFDPLSSPRLVMVFKK